MFCISLSICIWLSVVVSLCISVGSRVSSFYFLSIDCNLALLSYYYPSNPHIWTDFYWRDSRTVMESEGKTSQTNNVETRTTHW